MSASVLLVEDDPANRLVLSKTLESVGYQVTTAVDGSSAFELLERMPFDVVVVDMRLSLIHISSSVVKLISRL